MMCYEKMTRGPGVVLCPRISYTCMCKPTCGISACVTSVCLGTIILLVLFVV